jgi:hypothetical protein
MLHFYDLESGAVMPLGRRPYRLSVLFAFMLLACCNMFGCLLQSEKGNRTDREVPSGGGNPRLDLTVPAAGADLRGVSALRIAWTATGEVGPYIGLQLYRDTAMVWELPALIPTAEGEFSWSPVPEWLPSGDVLHAHPLARRPPRIDMGLDPNRHEQQSEPIERPLRPGRRNLSVAHRKPCRFDIVSLLPSIHPPGIRVPVTREVTGRLRFKANRA